MPTAFVQPIDQYVKPIGAWEEPMLSPVRIARAKLEAAVAKLVERQLNQRGFVGPGGGTGWGW